MKLPQVPFVSVIVPARNELLHIHNCLDSLLAQDYPAAQMEILFIDGASADGSREIAQQYARRYAHMRVLDNPRGIVPVALNIGICAAKGTIIVRVDGHCVLADDYISNCVDRLQQTDAMNVGGPMAAVGVGPVGKAIALATGSPFGIGNSRFHYSHKEEYVDTVYLGAFRREVFDRIGYFDEALVRNQDDEFNYRIRAAGGRILLSPRIRSHYFGRQRFRDLFRQYLQYGYWKVRVGQKHPHSLLPRHFAPGIFVLALITLGLSALISGRARRISAFAIAGYLAASLFASVRTASSKNLSLIPLVSIAYGCLHFGYGLGFLLGALRLLVGRLGRSNE